MQNPPFVQLMIALCTFLMAWQFRKSFTHTPAFAGSGVATLKEDIFLSIFLVLIACILGCSVLVYYGASYSLIWLDVLICGVLAGFFAWKLGTTKRCRRFGISFYFSK